MDDSEMESRMGSGQRFERVWEHVRHPQRRGHGLRLIAAVLILLVSAIPIERQTLSELERSIFEAINGLPGYLLPVLGSIMELGNLLAVPVVALIAYYLTKRSRLALDLAMSGAAAWVLSILLKGAFGRGRPGDLLVDVIFRGNAPHSGLGFVSGHTAVATALATVIAAYVGPRGNVIVSLLAATVGVARIYVGAHLPLDVVGGAALGWAVGSLVHFLVLPEVLGNDDAVEDDVGSGPDEAARN